MSAYQKLLLECYLIRDLQNIYALLDWDQQTYMPLNAANDRAAQLTTLAGLVHEKTVSCEFGRLLEQSEKEMKNADPDSDEKALLRVLRRSFDKEQKVPQKLIEQLAETASNAHQAWVKAKENRHFPTFAPLLEKLLDLRREYAACFAPYDNIYDPLLDHFEEGCTSAALDVLFQQMQQELVPLIRQITDAQQADDSFLHQYYDPEKQLRFSEDILHRIGYDFTRGRQDQSVHPFTTGFGINDVRITTKIIPDQPTSVLLSSIHECGHALYEQGIAPHLNRTPLAEGVSLGLHESQSRLWENQVGRSLPFWEYALPLFRNCFPEQLRGVSARQLYAAVNKVQPSLIRTEADEVTYNLHIILRYEMEKELLTGKIAVRDAAEAWNEKSRKLLGITPDHDSDGILQDIHWSMGEFGYFPTYALGNIYAAMIWEKAEETIPGLNDSIRTGDFQPLLTFLRERIHCHGAKYTPLQTLKLATGKDHIEPACLIRQFKQKYFALIQE
ncbi:MAG: carboxypeptidase M32 [Lentisphaeria bacterium]|nr:carboxypeptidase M32 [Lentisphaeria bacterium]